MTTTRLAICSLLLVAACGDDGGTTGGAADAPIANPTVTVTGKAEVVGLSGRTPEADVMIAAYKEGESTPVAMTMSGADGSYSIVITTNGVALDGYLLAKKAGLKDTYLYPPAPIAADIPNAPVLMLSPGTFDAAGTVAQAPQDPGMGFIAMMVIDAANMPVGGATISSTPTGTIRYNADGLPNKDATVTEADGIAYVFNVAPGTVTVNAAKAGATFHGHPVNARADQLTTTLIQ
ncbi:MAG: hypothetical protein H0T79_19925 [Deltaproteobacteria bacterium]|nr:hypothetical protein [Deltaproteobacteria bacterium]